MRNLNIEELENEIRDQASEIEYINEQHLRVKLHQFLNFLDSQPISKRILQRFEEDYSELKNKIPYDISNTTNKIRSELIQSLNTPEQQGAFGYFLIIQTSKTVNIYDNIYIYLAQQLYDCRGDSCQLKDDFNTLFFKPFIKLLLWYISESQSHSANDYFSKKEVEEFSEKLDDLFQNQLYNLLIDIRNGQEIIFEEIQDLKEQLKSLKKKNWGELLKGKLFDLSLSKIISLEGFSLFYEIITGDKLNFLDK